MRAATAKWCHFISHHTKMIRGHYRLFFFFFGDSAPSFEADIILFLGIWLWISHDTFNGWLRFFSAWRKLQFLFFFFFQSNNFMRCFWIISIWGFCVHQIWIHSFPPTSNITKHSRNNTNKQIAYLVWLIALIFAWKCRVSVNATTIYNQFTIPQIIYRCIQIWFAVISV